VQLCELRRARNAARRQDENRSTLQAQARAGKCTMPSCLESLDRSRGHADARA
jgi:hypothetical protein